MHIHVYENGIIIVRPQPAAPTCSYELLLNNNTRGLKPTYFKCPIYGRTVGQISHSVGHCCCRCRDLVALMGMKRVPVHESAWLLESPYRSMDLWSCMHAGDGIGRRIRPVYRHACKRVQRHVYRYAFKHVHMLGSMARWMDANAAVLHRWHCPDRHHHHVVCAKSRLTRGIHKSRGRRA